jgi:hypothetical protein
MRRKLLLFFVALTLCFGGSARDTPHILKRFHLYNQSGAIGPVTVYTPQRGHGGIFRVDTFTLTTVGNGEDGYLSDEVGSTNRVGRNRLGATTRVLLLRTTGYVAQGTVTVADLSGKPLTFAAYAYGTHPARSTT